MLTSTFPMGMPADATATAADIRSGKTAYVNGAKITGTIPSQGAQTITPGTANKTIAAGKYLSGAQTIKGDQNLKAENIAQGVSIFGVAGTHKGGAELSIVYSDTAPGADAGELWVKAAEPSSVYIAPEVTLTGTAIKEDTGDLNTTRLNCLCAGGYNGKVYMVLWAGSVSSNSSQIYSLYRYDPSSGAMENILPNFASENSPQNYSVAHSGGIQNGKAYVGYDGNKIVVVDLDTLVATSFIGNNEFLYYSSGEAYRRITMGISADGTTAYAFNRNGDTLAVFDFASRTVSTVNNVGTQYAMYYYDDGQYLYVLYASNVIRAHNRSTYAVVASAATPGTRLRAFFVVGENMFIGCGQSSVYKVSFNGSAFEFAHITDDAPLWATNAVYDTADGYGDAYSQWTLSCRAFAVIGNSVYFMSKYRSNYEDVNILKMTFTASEYAPNSLIVTTTGANINRANLITSDSLNVKVNVSGVYAVDGSGSMSQVSGYTKNTAGEWEEV